MISPKDIRAKAEKWWNDKSFLQSILNGNSFFPKDVPQIGLVKPEQRVLEFLKIKAEQDELFKNSKEVVGFGYSLEWEEKNYQNIGKNKFITRIYFETEEDCLAYIQKEKEFRKFQEDVKLIIASIPELNQWIFNNPLMVIKYHKEWKSFLKVLLYFIKEHKKDLYYIRELPIKIHTKFIETNKAILNDLLDTILPSDRISKEYTGIKNFEKRYGLKYEQPLIRMRILDDEISKKYLSGLKDITITQEEFNALTIPFSRLIVLENKTNYSNLMNFLTLPSLKGSLGIFGSGFKVGILKEAEWLKNTEIYYWGDIDAQGLQILSQIRGYFPATHSVMMDAETLNLFRDECGEGTFCDVNQLYNLSAGEKKLFEFLKEHNIRLEQEKISQEYVLEKFRLLNVVHSEKQSSS